MLAESLISSYLPVANPASTLKEVLEQMSLFNLLHLPVVEQSKYLGLVSKQHLEMIADPDSSLAEHLAELPLEENAVHKQQHFYDVVDLMINKRLTVVPVIGENEQFEGAIAQGELIQALKHVTASEERGFIIVLEIQKNDYSLTEISSIVESNNSRILSLYISPAPANQAVYVNIKISGDSRNAILLSFQRYGYEVAYVFSNSEEQSDSQERYDALMRYLNI